MTALLDRFIALENVVHRLLVRYSVSALRIAVGAIFLGFGVLKYFPGVSPAERLATDTTDVLFLAWFRPTSRSWSSRRWSASSGSAS